jgi:hypothetical protein
VYSAVAVVLENLSALDSSDDDVMQRSWSIQSGFAWHAMQSAKKGANVK